MLTLATFGGLSWTSTGSRLTSLSFIEAMRQDDAERAAGLYIGPFLDSAYLAGRYVVTLETMAGVGHAPGRPPVAVEWWWRLAAADPFSSRVAAGLMEAG